VPTRPQALLGRFVSVACTQRLAPGRRREHRRRHRLTAVMVSLASSIAGEAALLESPLDGSLADRRMQELHAMCKIGP
jgi:hypothetical protein